MLKFRLLQNKKYLELYHWDADELLKLRNGFKRLDKSYFVKRHHLDGTWDGYESFLIQNRYVATGLWYELVKFCQSERISFQLDGLEAIRQGFEFDEDEFDVFVDKLLEGTEIDEVRYYQIEAAKRILKWKYACAEVATASGKTLVLFIVASWLKWKGYIDTARKMVIVTSRTQLIGQIFREFTEEYNNGLIPIKTALVGGKKNPFKQKHYDECEVCIITYQSMQHRDNEFFSCIDVFGVDEAHTAKGKTIPNGILKCDDLLMRFGVSGTIKVEEKYSIYFKIQQHLGPLIMRYEAHQLISDGFAPEVFVKMVYLNYRDVMTTDMVEFRRLLEDAREMYDDPVEFGKEMYNIERRLVRENDDRLRFIKNMTRGLRGNKLILFNDVKEGYGQRIANTFEQSGITTHYIDGFVDVNDRNNYTNMMDGNDNMVLVASFGTYSTGVNLKNVSYIILTESFKADILIRQTIGRGMRNFKDKLKIIIIDLVDTFGKYGRKHSGDRSRIYNKNKFPVKKYEVVLPKVQ